MTWPNLVGCIEIATGAKILSFVCINSRITNKRDFDEVKRKIDKWNKRNHGESMEAHQSICNMINETVNRCGRFTDNFRIFKGKKNVEKEENFLEILS